MALRERKIAFIGGGHITEVLIDNFLQHQTVDPARLIVSDPNPLRIEKLREKYRISTAPGNIEAVSQGDFVFVNVLPQVVPEVLDELKRADLSGNKLIVSVAAGISMQRYVVLGDRLPVVRILPNPPSQIGRGVVAIAYNDFATKVQRSEITELLGPLGFCVVLEERHINAVTAMTTPATVFMFFQSLIDAGVRAGIDRETCTRIAYQTITGAMAVWDRRKVPPAELMAEASTPGGISVECLFVLEKYGFRAAISEAIEKGTCRAAEFSNRSQ